MCHISGPLSSLSNWQRERVREGGNGEREGGKGGRQGPKSGDKTMYTACTCCPKYNKKGFALNDSEQRLNIYWGERFMYDTSMNSLLWPHYIMIQYLVLSLKNMCEILPLEVFQKPNDWTTAPQKSTYIFCIMYAQQLTSPFYTF